MRFRNAPWDPGVLTVISQGWVDRCSAVRQLRDRCSSHVSTPALPLVTSVVGSSEPVGGCGAWPPIDACLIFDGAWMPTSNQARVDWILRDPVLLAVSGRGAQACVLGSALQAELLACYYAVRMAIRRGYLRVFLYSDSGSLVRLFSSKCAPPVSILWLVRDLRALLSEFLWVAIQKVPRTMVQPAHVLAGSARRRQLLRHRF